ncbi:hypothetical protein [Solitalea lacus]|uniref:hypothetical protein n=1 Tax=Solitalea lacus TaxID=2911172 RepID=UPI001EDAEDED|nr:hypothetical protein [Solitalea lacus]UKJ06199.1 hypothetical protein L2B55_11690 [Solitalea lacus]
MKKIFTLMVFTLSTLTSFAQVDNISAKSTVTDSVSYLKIKNKLKKLGHFTFKDIPINDSLNQFVAQLKKQGFTPWKITDLKAYLTGKFTGDDVHVMVEATPKTVYSVTVMYDKQTTWKSIKSQYDNMKSMLISKYGEPVESVEKFDSPYYEGSSLELYALNEDRCTYRTVFASKAGNGMIQLKISSDASLVINYVDALNYMIVSGEARNDL